MAKLQFSELTDRALLRVTGTDAPGFLQGILTCDVEHLKPGQINFGALLSPQGKILFDFFLVRTTNGFMIDIDKTMLQDFVRRLSFYKLRAKVDFAPMDKRAHVFAVWNTTGSKVRDLVLDGIYADDPRLSKLGARAYIRRAPDDCEVAALKQYHKHRIKLGIPHGGADFAFGDAFPHEALMDQFKGVDFQKGCYIGQEVVSRMQHRGTARKRFVCVNVAGDKAASSELPDCGSEIFSNLKSIGEITSKDGKNGIALIRLDRAGPAVIAGEHFLAGSLPVTLKIQEWATFAWPQ